MRLYMNAEEAFEEIKRDLSEMGIKVFPKTMQDKYIWGNPDYETLELQNYNYTILDITSDSIPGVVQPWADLEFEERVTDPYSQRRYGKLNWENGDKDNNQYSWVVLKDDIDKGNFINPGKAYLERLDVWEEYLHDGKLAYTYNELIWKNDQLTKVIERIKEDPDSRQLWVSLWDNSKHPDLLGGLSRVPCSLGYGFQVREGKLNMHYVMRSCDFSTHFRNDVYLAVKLLEYVAKETGYPVGNFTHTIFSLHIYKKDAEGVF